MGHIVVLKKNIEGVYIFLKHYLAIQTSPKASILDKDT